MIRIDVTYPLSDFTLDIKVDLPASGITALFGPSGAGKTTLINLVSGLISPQRGNIWVKNRCLFDSERSWSVPTHKRNIGYVFQDARLFPHYTVKGNLQYGMPKHKQEKWNFLVDLLGLEELLLRYPITLSGGEKQRVAIGRALLSASELLIMDEPLASLDRDKKAELLPYLEKLNREIQIPILYVSHSLEEIVYFADNIIRLDKGKVDLHTNLDQINHKSTWQIASQKRFPTNLFLAHFESHADNALKSYLQLGKQRFCTDRVDDPIGRNVRIMIDANDLSLSKTLLEELPTNNVISTTIVNVSHKEREVTLQLEFDEYYLWAEVSRTIFDLLDVKKGDTLYAHIGKIWVKN